jgi:hypothetical protein
MPNQRESLTEDVPECADAQFLIGKGLVVKVKVTCLTDIWEQFESTLADFCNGDKVALKKRYYGYANFI